MSVSESDLKILKDDIETFSRLAHKTLITCHDISINHNAVRRLVNAQGSDVIDPGMKESAKSYLYAIGQKLISISGNKKDYSPLAMFCLLGYDIGENYGAIAFTHDEELYSHALNMGLKDAPSADEDEDLYPTRLTGLICTLQTTPDERSDIREKLAIRLLKAGGDATGAGTNLPLIYAAQRGRMNMVHALLEAGAVADENVFYHVERKANLVKNTRQDSFEIGQCLSIMRTFVKPVVHPAVHSPETMVATIMKRMSYLKEDVRKLESIVDGKKNTNQNPDSSAKNYAVKAMVGQACSFMELAESSLFDLRLLLKEDEPSPDEEKSPAP